MERKASEELNKLSKEERIASMKKYEKAFLERFKKTTKRKLSLLYIKQVVLYPHYLLSASLNPTPTLLYILRQAHDFLYGSFAKILLAILVLHHWMVAQQLFQ